MMITRIYHRCIIGGLLSLLILAASASAADKLSDRARQALTAAGPETPHLLWLFLAEGTRASQPIMLTDRARARRARVDPVGLLIDEHDYPIRQDLVAAVEQTGCRIRTVSRWLRAVALDATPAQVESVQRLPFVDRIDLVNTLVTPIETQPKARLERVPHPPLAAAFDYGPSYLQIGFIKADRLHLAGLTGNGVLIALFDSGFKTDIAPFDSTTIVATWDFINGDTTVDEFGCNPGDPQPQNEHGTRVLSVIGAHLPGTLVGVAPGADYILAKTEITCGGTEIKIEEQNWVAAAEWADSIGTDIFSSSLGYLTFQDSGSYTVNDLDGNTALITVAADMAAARNILVVNSAGNHRQTLWGTINFPSDGDSVIAAGAVRSDSNLAPFSSPGPTADGRIKPDIATLGVDVLTFGPDSSIGISSGTSYATPLVAGGAALALEHDPTMTAADLRSLIRATGSLADRPNNDFGYGLYDAARAADIVSLEPVNPIIVIVDSVLTVPVTSSGRSPVPASLTTFNTPAGVVLTDNGDGTGVLDVLGSEANPRVLQFGLVADVGYFADTIYVTLETLPASGLSIFAAPNPFHDSVSIIVAPSAGTMRAITIFSVAGEQVWESVNSNNPAADIITTWYGRNRLGRNVAAGVYLIYVVTDQRSTTLKVLKTE